MRIKAEHAARTLADSLCARAGLECVTLGEAAETDLLDPYFSLAIDAYFQNGVPSLDERIALYGKGAHFETDIDGSKDRFFLEDIPVHVNLVAVEAIDALLREKDIPGAIIRETGTHLFYRIAHFRELSAGSAWLSGAREALAGLANGFWESLSRAYRAKMEHFLSDMGASVMRGDDFFSLVSTSEFLKYTVSALYAVNRRFEPSHRFIAQGVKELPVLPDNFMARWEALLKSGPDSGAARKYEVAKLLAKSVLALA